MWEPPYGVDYLYTSRPLKAQVKIKNLTFLWKQILQFIHNIGVLNFNEIGKVKRTFVCVIYIVRSDSRRPLSPCVLAFTKLAVICNFLIQETSIKQGINTSTDRIVPILKVLVIVSTFSFVF